MNADSPTQSVDIDIFHILEITLIIDDATFSISSDYADWVRAYFSINSIIGYINKNNFIDILDIVQIVNITLNSLYNEVADINNDNIVNILDIVLLVNIILTSILC